MSVTSACDGDFQSLFEEVARLDHVDHDINSIPSFPTLTSILFVASQLFITTWRSCNNQLGEILCAYRCNLAK